MREAHIEHIGHEKVDLALCDSSYHTGIFLWFGFGMIFYDARRHLYATAMHSQGVDRVTLFGERDDPLKVHEI